MPYFFYNFIVKPFSSKIQDLTFRGLAEIVKFNQNKQNCNNRFKIWPCYGA